MSQADAETLRATLQLALLPGVGPGVYRSLMERFGSPQAALGAPWAQLCSVRGVGDVIAKRVASAHELVDVDEELKRCQDHGIRIAPESSPDYPRALKNIHDPPVVLFLRGELQGRDELAVAIVGSRHATRYGVQQAERLAAGLALRGLTIVSGLARGIDAAAHRGALGSGGRTLAVLASGLANIYPPEHAELADQIVNSGALLSESPPAFEPLAGSFPRRNRLISGLSQGVLVVEASERSGALITARHAGEQGREVFAVPGPVTSRASRGCHRLIRDGAKLVESVDDVLEELGPLPQPARVDADTSVSHPIELSLNEQEQQVLRVMGADPLTMDEVIAQSGLPASRVLATISALERRRLIARISGNTIARR